MQQKLVCHVRPALLSEQTSQSGSCFHTCQGNVDPEEVGQAGRKASWVPVPNCARDFIDSLAVVE